MYFYAQFFYPRFRPTSSFVEKIRICDHRSMTDYHRKRLSKCAASNLGWRRIGRMDFIIRAAAVSTDYRGLFQLSVWICRGPLTPNLLSVRVSLDSLRTKKNLWFKRRSNMSSTIRPSISSLYRAQKIGSRSCSKKKFFKDMHVIVEKAEKLRGALPKWMVSQFDLLFKTSRWCGVGKRGFCRKIRKWCVRQASL